MANRPADLAFIDATLRYGDQPLIDEVLGLLHDRDKVRQISMAAAMAGFPDQGVQSQTEFDKWRKSHRKEWDEFWKSQH
jgi:hypothetical protein